jgi:hypothetical protein
MHMLLTTHSNYSIRLLTRLVRHVIEAGGAPTVAFTWRDEPSVRALLACAAAGEPSAARVRAAALSALCSLLRDEEAPRGPDGGAAVLDALLAAADGIFEGVRVRVRVRVRHLRR